MQLAQEVQVVKRETEKNQTSAIFPAPARTAEKNRSKVLQMAGNNSKQNFTYVGTANFHIVCLSSLDLRYFFLLVFPDPRRSHSHCRI